MMSPMDTRICRTTPTGLEPLSDHERTVDRLRSQARRNAWRAGLVRLLRVILRRVGRRVPVNPPS